ncbi:MAG: ATP-binding protein [Clostridia bacterium]|nr:ATP-binding protein [Clostridia bacterium]
MEGIEVFFDGLRNIGMLFIAELIIVVPAMPRRSLFPVRIICSVAIMCILCAVYLLFYIYLNAYLWYISAVWYFFVAICTGGLIFGCFKMHITEVLWSMITAYAVQHMVYAVTYELIFPQVTFGNPDFWLIFATYFVIGAAIYVLFGVLNHLNRGYIFFDYSDQHKARYSILFSILFIVFLGSTFVNQVNVVVSTQYIWLCGLADLITCIFMVVLQLIVLYVSRVVGEKRLEDGILAAEKNQYLAFKNSVDYINVKVHDLKHEIARMKQGNEVDSGRLQEVADNIAIYEAFAKTGNEDLDIVLTEKNLMCLSDHITLTYLAEADKLSVMSADDIYSFFGNMLDNAIECERKMPEGSRFIRLFIKPSGSFLIIHCENYFAGDVRFHDGLPISTKGDSTKHGFGTRSMQLTAKRYGGQLRMSVEDSLFKTELLLNI